MNDPTPVFIDAEPGYLLGFADGWNAAVEFMAAPASTTDHSE